MTPALAKRRDEMAEKHSAIIGRLRFAFDEKPSLSTVGKYAGHDYRVGFDAAAAIFEQRERQRAAYIRKSREALDRAKKFLNGGGDSIPSLLHEIDAALSALESSRVEGEGGK